jgi:hypothetical protein
MLRRSFELAKLTNFLFDTAMDGLSVFGSIPCDEEDGCYTKSFPVCSEENTGMLDFFREYGFVVVRDVFTAQECSDTRQAMWSILESSNPGFIHDDQSTWNNLKSKGSYGRAIISLGAGQQPVGLAPLPVP